MFALRNQALSRIYLQTLVTLTGTLLGTLLGGCSAAMKTTIENRGTLPVELGALCGDASYRTSLLAAGTITWQPTANACSLAITSASGGRRLAIRNECQHAAGCSLSVTLPAQGTTRLAGTGQLEIVGDVATVGSSSGP